MFKIILMIILLLAINGCKSVEIWSSKDGTENKSCFVDNSCKNNLICNNDNICVKDTTETKEITENLTTNIPIDENVEKKDIIKENKRKEDKIIENNPIKKKKNKDLTNKKEKFDGKLGSRCNSISDCDGDTCIKYRDNKYRCSKRCKKDKNCPKSLPTCHNWLHKCINDDK